MQLLALAVLALLSAASAVEEKKHLREFYAPKNDKLALNKNNNDNSLLVQTSIGLLQGHYNEAGVREWKGIPYAKPPQGELRFEYPQAPEPFSEIYVADKDVNGCPQSCNLPPGNCPAYGTSEDCLYLSVFAPKDPPNKDIYPNGYPVFFWIHGGIDFKMHSGLLYKGLIFAN